MTIRAFPFVALIVVAVAHCGSNGASTSCPSAKDISYGGACSAEGVTCDAINFCNTGAPSQAICKQGSWTAPAGCLEGGPAYSPCTQLGGSCRATCTAGTHAVAAADACSNLTDQCCLPGDADAGDGGDASDAGASD